MKGGQKSCVFDRGMVKKRLRALSEIAQSVIACFHRGGFDESVGL